MEIKRPGRRKGRCTRQRLDQQRFIRFQRCGDFHAMAGAALFQNDRIGAEFGPDLRHGFGHIGSVEKLEPHASAAPLRGRQV